MNYFKSIVTIVSVVMAILISQTTFSASVPDEQTILTILNAHRTQQGLAPLTMNAAISDVAREYSQKMANGTYPFGHGTTQQMTTKINAITAKLGPIQSWGENIAYNSQGYNKIIQGWLNSPGHKKNIEGNFNLTGIGVAYNKQGWTYVTQIFILKK